MKAAEHNPNLLYMPQRYMSKAIFDFTMRADQSQLLKMERELQHEIDAGVIEEWPK